MVAVKSFAAGGAPWLAASLAADAHDTHDAASAADQQVAQVANAEPVPGRLRAPLEAGRRGGMPRAVWIGRDGAREARSGLLANDVLEGCLQHAKR